MLPCRLANNCYPNYSDFYFRHKKVTKRERPGTSKDCHHPASAPVPLSVLIGCARATWQVSTLNITFRKDRGQGGWQLLADIFLNHAGANPGFTVIAGSSSASLLHVNSNKKLQENEEVEQKKETYQRRKRIQDYMLLQTSFGQC